jgi:aromatic ring-opening dioxygenase catalytic subunit (LigB family)
MSSAKMPTLFISHGGGPCFFMDPPPRWPRDTWDRLAVFLRGLAGSLGRKPRALLVISGHWETDPVAVNTAARPGLLFDYYGFPEHTYQLTYPVDGAPALAEEVRGLLAKAGFPSEADAGRGLDHGVFVPFMLIYPDADVPVLQMSLRRDLDPAAHLAIGAALAPLRERDVLIVGSGMSYHNLPNLFSGRGNEAAEAFDAWLHEAVGDPKARDQALRGWRDAPGAVECHPEAEHLLPLMVAAGAAGGEPGARVYADHVLGKAVSGFRFG